MYMLKSRQQMPPDGSCTNVDTFFCLQSIVFSFLSMESNDRDFKVLNHPEQDKTSLWKLVLDVFHPLSSWHFCASL